MHVYGIIELEPDGRPGKFIKIGKGPADRRVLNHQTGNPRKLQVAFWALYRSDKVAEKIEASVLASTKAYATDAMNEWRRLDGNVLAALDALRHHPETVETKWEVPLLNAERLALAAELRHLEAQLADGQIAERKAYRELRDTERTRRRKGRVGADYVLKELEKKRDCLERKRKDQEAAPALKAFARRMLGAFPQEPDTAAIDLELNQIREQIEARRIEVAKIAQQDEARIEENRRLVDRYKIEHPTVKARIEEIRKILAT